MGGGKGRRWSSPEVPQIESFSQRWKSDGQEGTEQSPGDGWDGGEGSSSVFHLCDSLEGWVDGGSEEGSRR